MPRCRITVNDQAPFIVGPSGTESFSFTVHDGLTSDDSPKALAMTYEVEEGRGTVSKFWLDEVIFPGTKIQVEMLDDGDIDSPVRIEVDEKPVEMCWYCFKTAEAVEFLVRAPTSTMHICNMCVDICAAEIRTRQTAERDDT